MKLNPDFKEFLKLFIEKKVEFLVVGGYAVSFYGYPRYTGDLDILITSIDGVSNEDLFSQKINADFYALETPIISKAHLIENKRATGRPRDLLDIENLK